MKSVEHRFTQVLSPIELICRSLRWAEEDLRIAERKVEMAKKSVEYFKAELAAAERR